MAFFMDIIRDSRRRVAERHDVGIAQWPGVPDGDVLPGQEGAVARPTAEPKPNKSRVRFPRRQQAPTDEEKKTERVEDHARGSSVENLGPEPGRLSFEAAPRPPGRREVQAAPAASVTDRIAPRHEPPAVQRKHRDSSPAVAQVQAAPSGPDAVRGFSDPAGHQLPSQGPDRVSVAPGAPEGAPVAGTPPHLEPSRSPDMPVSRPGMQVGGMEHSLEPGPPSGRMVVREATPGERVSISQGSVEAQSAAPVHRRLAAVAEAHRRGESSPGGGLPVVRIGQVNVIVESPREARNPKASTGQGEDLASRNFLRSL
ncbi:MAG: hypothetical protein MUC41_04275 [Syntrophobacteraceae bacterium]|nr:hypothetical protein [Syntrophobacteraceae bacterium]